MAHRTDIINTAEYVNAKDKEDQSVNTVKKPKTHSTKYEFNNENSNKDWRRIRPINEKSDTKNKCIQHAQKD